jgi:serine-type D-Ala-D-Ala carboxypeptidase (penicillin-binding protein 5/6)
LLVPSGNNIADLLAVWDAGSVSAFAGKMNVRAAAAGLANTKYVDASGFSPNSVGTPSDLIKLAELAMQNPVFAEIVSQPEATLPVAGRVFNVDAALGQEGIIGVKTGSSSQAGACFVFAADVKADDQPARIFGVVLGLPTLDDAFNAATGLVHAAVPGLHYRSIISTDQVIAEYAAPWDDQATIFVEQDVSWVVYDGMTLHETTDLKPIKPPLASGSNVGSVTVRVGDKKTSIPLKTTGGIFDPDVFWRLTRLGSSSLF